MSDLRLEIAAVAAARRPLDEVGGWDATGSYSRWAARRQQAEQAARLALLAAGARIKENWQGATITFGGVRATSTGGLHGALANWLRAARARAEGGARG